MGNEIDYYCPECGDKVWAYKGFENNKCMDCISSGKSSGPSGRRGPIQVAESNYIAKKSHNDFLCNCYESDGKTVKIGGYTFTNVVPKGSSEDAVGWYHVDEYKVTSDTYVCGLNAINMSLKLWGYDKQIKKSEYGYEYVDIAGIPDLQLKWGMSGEDYYKYNIEPVFDYCGYSSQRQFLADGIDFNWKMIDGTDYTNYNLIILGGYGTAGHYMMIIGVDKDKQHYLVTDQETNVYLVDTKCLKSMAIYSTIGYQQHSLYKVG